MLFKLLETIEADCLFRSLLMPDSGIGLHEALVAGNEFMIPMLE